MDVDGPLSNYDIVDKIERLLRERSPIMFTQAERLQLVKCE